MTQTLLRGRSAEVDTTLRVLAETATTGRSTVLVVSGEAGLGKTALVERARAQAQRDGFTACVGKAEELDRISPMATLLLALRGGRTPLLSEGDLAAVGPLLDQQLWLVDRIAAPLEERAQQTPILIAVDDVQWADPLTLFALRLLPPRLSSSPIVWLLTARDTPATSTELSQVIPRDLPVHQITLEPLSPTAMRELATDRLGTEPGPRLARLLQGTAGNPFLVTELLEGVLSEEMVEGGDVTESGPGVPTKLRTALRRRLSGPYKDVWSLLQAGSVLGGTFSIDDAAALRRVPVSDLLPSLHGALAEGMLVDTGLHVTFRHDLIREAAYEDLTPTARRVLHRSAAEHLLATGRTPVDAAHHLMAGASAGDRDAANVLRRAAAEVAPQSPTTAVSLITHAYNLLPRRDRLRLEVGQEVVDIFVRARRVQDAIFTADELLRTSPDAETAARIHSRLARPLWDLGLDERLLDRVTEALELDGISPQVRALLLAQRALALSRSDEPDAAVRAAHVALADADEAGDVDARTTALRALGHAAATDGRYADALDFFQQVRAVHGGPAHAGELRALALLDRYDEARDGLSRSRREAEEHGGTWEVPAFGWLEAAVDLAASRLDEAEAGARTIVRLAEDLQEYGYRLQAYALLTRIAQLRGDLRQAGEYAAEARRWTRSDVRLASAQGTLSHAQWLDASGDAAGATRLLAAAADSPAALTRHTAAGYADLPTVVRIALRGKDTALAQRAALLAQQYADRNPGVATAAGSALHAKALLEDDVDLFGEAVAVLRDSPRLLSRASAAEDHGRALVAHGRRELGVAELDRAWDAYVALGATGEARRVQRRLQSTGARRRRWMATTRRPRTGWDALTDTERRVASLVAEGRTNRDVAQTLSLSPNTVGTHLRSIFGKLGVSSRVQLTREVLSRP
ncbi:AAA family ATPase [Actinopolymorpha sp. NPDC004070]|uniref:helix-turn-helix transcriptional regulator n=1 Tax=Actinopolymorpha sp. NPDC004070 TaxID=3154548 RepID=UPI0033BCEEFF